MHEINSCQECTTTDCFVRLHSSSDWITIIDRNKNQEVYERGQFLFREGSRVFGLYFIQAGKVKVISTGLNGKEHIVRLASKGHVVGHRGIGSETYPIGAVALEDTVACFVDNDSMFEAYMDNPRLTYAMMMFYAHELRKTEIRQRLLAQMNMREKVAEILLHLKDTFGLDTQKNTLNVLLSRQELADMLGSTPEQVTRMLTDFEEKMLIRKDGKQILLLNEEGLHEIIAAHDLNRKIYPRKANHLDA